MFRSVPRSVARPGLAIAVSAVVLAAGGTATAQSLIGGKQVRDNSLTSADIRNGSVRGADLRNRTVTLGKLSTATRAALRGQAGPKGLPGAAGSKGDKGDKGDMGESGSPGTVGSRGPSDLRFNAVEETGLQTCTGFDAAKCPDVLSRTLAAGNWLVQVKFLLFNDSAVATNGANQCAIVRNGVVLDKVGTLLAGFNAPNGKEVVSLMAIVQGAGEGANVGLRCTQQVGEDFSLYGVKLTALQVQTVTGP